MLKSKMIFGIVLFKSLQVIIYSYLFALLSNSVIHMLFPTVKLKF